MRVTIQGAVPYPPMADSMPVRQFANDLRKFAQGMQQTSTKLQQATSVAQDAWKGAAATAQQERSNERRQVIESVANAVNAVVPILETYAAALDTSAGAYTTAATAEMAARAGLPWTAAALAAAIGAEAAIVGGLQAAAGAGAGAAAGPIAQIAAAQFLGMDRENYEKTRASVTGVWDSVKDAFEDGKVDEQEIADAARKLQQAMDSLGSTTSREVATPESPALDPSTGLPTSEEYWDDVINQILVDGATDPVSPTATTSLRDRVFGTGSKPIDLDLAYVARDVYPDRTGSLPADSPFVRATDQQLLEMGIDPARMRNDATGFSAAVYFTREGNQAVLAFAGSDESADWTTTNLRQEFSTIDGQYQQGRALAEDLKVRFGDDMAIVGHSLGGGVGSYAGLATGTPVVTFNSAGLSTVTQMQSGTAPWNTDGIAEGGLIRRYTVDNEILTHIQEDNPVLDLLVPDAVGTRIPLSEPEPLASGGPWILDDRIDRHAMDVVIESMRRDQPWTGAPQAAGGSPDTVPAPRGATGTW